jgi:hypothetical protein
VTGRVTLYTTARSNSRSAESRCLFPIRPPAPERVKSGHFLPISLKLHRSLLSVRTKIANFEEDVKSRMSFASKMLFTDAPQIIKNVDLVHKIILTKQMK